MGFKRRGERGARTVIIRVGTAWPGVLREKEIGPVCGTDGGCVAGGGLRGRDVSVMSLGTIS